LGEGAQARVGRDAATDEQVVDVVLLAGEQGLAGEDVDDGLLEARGDVGDRHALAGPLAGLDPARHGGLEAREGEVEAVTLHVPGGRESPRKVAADPVALSPRD